MAATKTSPKTAVATRAANSKARGVKAADQRFQQAKRASILLKHVSDPTRLQVILILSEGERHVGALCAQLSQSQPAVSHHLALLRHGNIIAPRRQGKNNFYSLTETGSELANKSASSQSCLVRPLMRKTAGPITRMNRIISQVNLLMPLSKAVGTRRPAISWASRPKNVFAPVWMITPVP